MSWLKIMLRLNDMDILLALGISLILAGLLLLFGGLVISIKFLRKYFAIDVLRSFFIGAGVIYSVASVFIFIFILFGLYRLTYGY